MVDLRSAGRTTRRALAWVVVAGLTTAPGAALAESLADALATAITNSPDLNTQRAAVRGLDESVAQARAGYRPTVTGSASAAARYSNSSEATKSTQRLPLSVGATVSQSLYDGGQTANAVDGAIATVKSGRFTLLNTEQTVLLNAVTAYARVLEAQRNVSLARNNLEVNRQTLQAARDRLDVGLVPPTDVAQAEAAEAESRANLSVQEGVLAQRVQDYIRFVGAAPANLEPLPTLPELPRSLEEANQIAEKNHPSILAARSDVEAASFAVREAMGALMPQVDLTANVSQDVNNQTKSSDQFSSSAAIEVTVPFYQGGALRSRVRQAQASASQARAQLGVTSREVRLAVGNAWANLVSARASITANEAQVRAQQVAFEGVREEANVGTRSTLDVLESEQDKLDAQVALVGARTDLYVNAYSLLAQTGLLTVAKLGLDVADYDVETPYEASQQWDAGYEDSEDTEWQKNWRP